MPWNERAVTTTVAEAGTLWPVTSGNPDYLHNPGVVQQSTETVHTICEGNRSHWTSWDVTAMAREWASGGLDNNGVILWATNELVNGRDLRFAARENTNATIRPVLRVAYAEGTGLEADCSMFEDWSNECPADDDAGTTTQRPATTTAACRDGFCPGIIAPVCGTNGVTYTNGCRASLCDVRFTDGPCGAAGSPTTTAPARPPPTAAPAPMPTQQFAVTQECQGELQRLQEEAAASDLSFVGETIVIGGFDQRTCGPQLAFTPRGTRARFQLETSPSTFQGVARTDPATGRIEITSRESGSFAAQLTATDVAGNAITIATWSFVVSERPVTLPPTQAPSSSEPTRQPTMAPSRHACNDGTHGCDPTIFGICEQVDNGAGYQCRCAATHRCSDGDCHSCLWLTDAPTQVPTTSPTPTPTRWPSASPHSSLPTSLPTSAPSVAPTAPENESTADGSTGGEADSTSTTSIIIVVIVGMLLIIGVIVGVATYAMKHQNGDVGARPNFDNPMYASGPDDPSVQTNTPRGGAAPPHSNSNYVDVPPSHEGHGHASSRYASAGGSVGTQGYMDVGPSQSLDLGEEDV